METLKLEPEHKLTIEHLSHYLPYGLQIKIASQTGGFKIATMKLSDLQFIDIHPFKPLLLPLSELKSDTIFYEFGHTNKKAFIEMAQMGNASWLVMQYLFANKYDAFSLIDKGLAISKV
jgi:hypothetical protein